MELLRLAFLLSLALTVHSAPNRPQSGASVVSKNLATLSLKIAKSKYKRGEAIRVTVLLVAGRNGVYVPDSFGDWLTTCDAGFTAYVLTIDGKNADPTRLGCAASWLHSGAETAESRLHNFTYLRPGETRVWQTALSTGAIMPDQYIVGAEYLSQRYMIEQVAKLPEVRGLMAMGRIVGKPMKIQIH